jgi:FdhD protein
MNTDEEPGLITTRTIQVATHQIREGSVAPVTDLLAVEEPLEIRLGYPNEDGVMTRKSISITMRTPGHDDELAVGFLHGEGMLPSLAELHWVGRCPVAVRPDNPRQGGGNIIRVDLAEGTEIDMKRLERHFYTTSSCGVCGKTSLEALAIQGACRFTDDGPTIHRDVLVSLPDKLRSAQAVFDETGGLHAAALFDTAGRLRLLREDVGRHNALDKVIGRLLLDGQLPADDAVLLVSGRTSFELMQKALAAGIRIVAAVGAPSSLAAELAEEYGMSLIGFLRGERFNIYTNPQRIRLT